MAARADIQFLIIIDFISITLAIYMAIIFYRAKRNPMMFYFTLSVILLNALALMGIVYDFNWHKAPIELCYVQAIASQFGAFVTGISAFNFIIQVYRLLVLRKNAEIADSRLIVYYYGFLIAYPIIGTMLVAFVAFKMKAVGVRDLKCDIVSPTWVRLFGYNGINLLISIPGTYFSTRATLVVIRHLDEFKTSLSSTQSHTPMIEETRGNPADKDDVEDGIQESDNNNNTTGVLGNRRTRTGVLGSRRTRAGVNLASNRAYDVTRAAAIRMVFFTSAYLITNIGASIETVLFVLAKKPLSPHPGGGDIAFVSLGIALFLIFGTAGDVRRWTVEKFRNALRWFGELFLHQREF